MNHLWEAVEFFYYKHPWNFLWIRICGRSSWWSGEIRLAHISEEGFHSKMILLSFNLIGLMLSITALSVLVPVLKLLTTPFMRGKLSRLSLYLRVSIDTLSRSRSCLDLFPSFLCNSKKSRQMDELWRATVKVHILSVCTLSPVLGFVCTLRRCVLSRLPRSSPFSMN